MTTSTETRPECVILPINDFRDHKRGKMRQSGRKSPDGKNGGKTTTTMAALLAVTIRHDASMSAEESLIRIIEKSGEVEILDTEDALADMGFDRSELGAVAADGDGDPANDNSPVAVVSR